MTKPVVTSPPSTSLRGRVARWAFSTTLIAPLQRIESGITTLLQRTEQIMYSENQIEALIGDLNTATNKIASKIAVEEAAIQALKDQIAAGTPVSQSQLDSIGTSLSASVAALQALGADPTNPIPVTPVDNNPPVPAVG